MKKRNKMCYITVDNLETRNKVYEFFSSFELVEPRGFKQKLTINDAIYQFRRKGINDPLYNTNDSWDHFWKFNESPEKLAEAGYCKKVNRKYIFDPIKVKMLKDYILKFKNYILKNLTLMEINI